MDCKANFIYTGTNKTVSLNPQTYALGVIIAAEDGGLSEVTT